MLSFERVGKNHTGARLGVQPFPDSHCLNMHHDCDKDGEDANDHQPTIGSRDSVAWGTGLHGTVLTRPLPNHQYADGPLEPGRTGAAPVLNYLQSRIAKMSSRAIVG